MSKVRGSKSLGLLVAVTVLLVLGIAGIAYAITPTPHEGNPATPEGCLKIDPPTSGAYLIPGTTDKYVTITVSAHDPEGEELAFTSDLPVVKVWMKGGDGYNDYNFGSPGVTSAAGLICPLNNGGNVPDISHVTFCFEAAEPTTTTIGDVEDTTTTAGDVTTVTKVDTGAGGSTGLGTGTWALGILALALAGGLGWTALRPALRKDK